jgi:hypothetical protein
MTPARHITKGSGPPVSVCSVLSVVTFLAVKYAMEGSTLTY